MCIYVANRSIQVLHSKKKQNMVFFNVALSVDESNDIKVRNLKWIIENT